MREPMIFTKEDWLFSAALLGIPRDLGLRLWANVERLDDEHTARNRAHAELMRKAVENLPAKGQK